jgi:peptidoglycan/LPS O-acetylase OafA/YrhL
MSLIRGATISDRLASASARGPGFDQIRLVAALIVLAHHAWWGVNDVLYQFSGGFIQLGLFAVVIFFSVSGFLLAPGLVRSGDLVRFAVNRALRIFPALFVVVVASMFVLGPALTTYSLADYFGSPELYSYLKNVVTLMSHYLPGVVRYGHEVQINGPLWTLNIEIWSYAALVALSVVGFLGRRVLTLVVLGLFYLAYVALAFAPSLHAACPQRVLDFVSLFIYFITGTCLYLYGDRIPLSGFWAGLAVGLALVGVAGGLSAVVLPLCIPYVVVYLGLSDLAARVPLKHDLSYGVYLIHSPVILAMVTIFDLHTGWRLAAFAALATLVLAYASWRFVEEPALRQKAPVFNWISSRLRIFAGWQRLGIPTAAPQHERRSNVMENLEADSAQRREGAYAPDLS